MLIPAFVVAFVGGALQFSALTGLWVAWSVLWAAVPLAVALALLVISLVRRSVSLFVAASFIGGTALSVALGLGALLTHQWSVVGVVGGCGLVIAGIVLVAFSLLRGWGHSAPTFVHPGEGGGVPPTAGASTAI
jgi:predicted lysophospholipase L1 biosynthesis ABC-type transport system permease subunit